MISCKYKTLFFLLYYTLAFAACDNTNVLPQSKEISNDLYNEIFSETDVFYRPGSNVPVPLIRKPSTATKDRGPKGVYGWLPCFCHQEACSCCVDIRIKALNTHDSGCITISPSNYDNFTVDTGITLNNKTIMQERLSFDDPSPLCSPFPRFPFLSGCIKFNRIRADNGRLKGCARMELRITGTDAILWDMQFSCFRIGTDGIVFNKPNKNKEKEKPNKEPSKKPNKECKD